MGFGFRPSGGASLGPGPAAQDDGGWGVAGGSWGEPLQFPPAPEQPDLGPDHVGPEPKKRTSILDPITDTIPRPLIPPRKDGPPLPPAPPLPIPLPFPGPRPAPPAPGPQEPVPDLDWSPFPLPPLPDGWWWPL